MEKDLNYIRETLVGKLKKHSTKFKINSDTLDKFEVQGTIPAMQGKQKVDGFYFGSVIPKSKDVRLYFFPMYTHRNDLFDSMSPELAKFLKGKSCFHIKYLTPELEHEIEVLIQKSVKIYQKDNLLAKD
jgi:hypothetical protein